MAGKTTTSFGSALGTKRTRARDAAFLVKKEVAESCTSAEQMAFLVLPGVKELMDRHGDHLAF